MAEVIFTANELRARDDVLADRIEAEIREAAERLQPVSARIQCRILVEMTFDPALTRIRIQLERPGWVKSFGVAAGAAVEDVRRAADVILGHD